MQRRAIVALVAVAFVSATPTSSASTPTLSLTRADETARFEGQFGSAGVVASVPESCATTSCDEFFLDLDLRARDWNPDGGLQVGLRWSDEEQDLDLYVYGPDRRLAAKSDGLYASTAESVLIAAPSNGRYRILVVPRETTDLAYDGIAQIERGTASTPVRDLLPDLIALPPRHATFSAGTYLVPDPAVLPTSCYPEEERGRRLGDGPVQVGEKNGFCVVDIENIWFGRHGDAPRTYYFPQCQAPTDTGTSGPALRQGMSAGWADVYNWFLPGQYIEVSGLPDGYYLLDTFADVDGLVLEADETNNVNTALIRICGESADSVGEGTSCR